MAQQILNKSPRNVERFFLVLISVLLGFLFFNLYKVIQRDFADVPARLADGSMVNLNAPNPDQRIKYLLERGYYFEDPKDIELIRSVIGQRGSTDEKMDNIGELNKGEYNVNADQAYVSGGASYKKRVTLARTLLGYSGADSLLFDQERARPVPLPSSISLGLGNHSISGTLFTDKGAPLSGVLVRLDMILPQDSLYSNEVIEVTQNSIQTAKGLRKSYVKDTAGHGQLQGLTAYTRTGVDGKYNFTDLPSKKAFEIIPLQPGFQFGASKGVRELTKNVSLSFTQAPHKIKLFSTRDFNILKKERSLIVRTPQEFMKWFWIILICFFAAFFIVHLLLSFRFWQADQLLLPLIMLLIGISLLTLLSLQDPLRDRFLAKSTLGYFGGGIVGIIILMLFNLRLFSTDSALFRIGFFKTNRMAATGWQWAGLASLLLLLTIILGTGPQGSGVKVNLFGFQPSEVVKFLIIIFLAGFFSANERFISEYRSWQKRWTFFSFALFAILLTILLFLLLGDLGPAIVCCFTFIILFSFSRGDFAYMAGAVILYVVVIWAVKNIWLATGITVTAIVLLSLVWRKMKIESAVMALVVIAGFLLLDQVPFLDQLIPGPVQRLIDRKAIWQDAWNNDVYGGDQVANGIWAMASGGISGQGIGEGFAKTIPEAHTDMILPSIGEDLGWAGIICLFILFLLFLHRAIIIGRQTGTPFLFYLCAGIGIGTFVQFLLIAGGSTGALPLSGVSLPFTSYGGSSLIINMLAMGFLLSASTIRGTKVQMKFIAAQQDKNLVPALLAAVVGIILLSVNVSRYLFNNKKWVVQPALVADRSGARMFSYNPRIAILMNKLQAGNLYDRKGKLLATSKTEIIKAQQDSLVAAGLQKQNLENLSHKRLDRYYPFEEQMFFWTGDANTGIFSGGSNGYFAEYEHAAELRGFETPVTNYSVVASHFAEYRFLPPVEREMTVVKKDFSALAPLLLAGINSPEVEAFKQRNRDVQLTMDAGLQTAIQKALSLDEKLKNKRVSVVVMEDVTGDVLASAAFPLPPVKDWDLMNLSVREQNKLPFWLTATDIGFTYATQPGSTAKLLTAMAAFNKLGPAAANRTFLIRSQDLIRIKSEEPDETGTINLERAIVKSNNSYFIKLANEEKLQEQMATLYMQTGMFLRGVGGYYYQNDFTNTEQQEKWRNLWRKTEFRSLLSYNKNDIRATRGRGVSGMAWGQGELIATPASIARLACGIANGGKMVPNRYVLKISDSVMAINKAVTIAQEEQYATLLTSYMVKQSANKVDRLGIAVAGKTGTPERIWKGQRINDGWYVFFAPKAAGEGHVVVCIRIEATKGSSDAIKLAGEHVIPLLLQKGYIKSFENNEKAMENRP